MILILCHYDSCCSPFCLDHDNRIYAGEHSDLSLIPSPSPPTHNERNKILQLQKMSLRHALVGRKYGLDLARVAVKGPRSLSTRQLSTTSSRQKIIACKTLNLLSLRPSILSSCGTCVNCFNCSACPGCTVIPNRSMASAAEPKYVCMALSIMYCWNQINAEIVNLIIHSK